MFSFNIHMKDKMPPIIHTQKRANKISKQKKLKNNQSLLLFKNNKSNKLKKNFKNPGKFMKRFLIWSSLMTCLSLISLGCSFFNLILHLSNLDLLFTIVTFPLVTINFSKRALYFWALCVYFFIKNLYFFRSS